MQAQELPGSGGAAVLRAVAGALLVAVGAGLGAGMTTVRFAAGAGGALAGGVLVGGPEDS